MSNLDIAPPWVTYAERLNAFFKNDPDVRVELLEDKHTVNLYVENAVKAEALANILVTEVVFGNVTLYINVIPANNAASQENFFRQALAGNEAVAAIENVDVVGGGQASYILFKPHVVQYFNDNIADYHGITSTLYQDIAKEIFNLDAPGIFFCTDLEDEEVGIASLKR